MVGVGCRGGRGREGGVCVIVGGGSHVQTFLD